MHEKRLSYFSIGRYFRNLHGKLSPQNNQMPVCLSLRSILGIFKSLFFSSNPSSFHLCFIANISLIYLQFCSIIVLVSCFDLSLFQFSIAKKLYAHFKSICVHYIKIRVFNVGNYECCANAANEWSFYYLSESLQTKTLVDGSRAFLSFACLAFTWLLLRKKCYYVHYVHSQLWKKYA